MNASKLASVFCSGLLCALVAPGAGGATPVGAQSIQTEGNVIALGFIGDGSQVTDVDAELLDGQDSTAFALDADLLAMETLVLALQQQLDALGAAHVPRTGQVSCHMVEGFVTACGTGVGQGQDGDLQLGVVWPNPRFAKNGDGTVTDRLTGLIWLENANCANAELGWAAALAFANTLFDGSTDHNGGDCGLADGSLAGEWRLPNVREQQSLIHYAYGGLAPAVPNTVGTGQWVEGDPFAGVQHDGYWSSTTTPNTVKAWSVSIYDGGIRDESKDNLGQVWPVRGGQ